MAGSLIKPMGLMIEERSLGGICYGAVAGFSRLCDVFVTASLICLFAVTDFRSIKQAYVQKG